MKGRMLLLSMAAVFATAGCATKGHVARSIEPVQNQVDELAAKTGKHDEQIKQANEEIAKNRTEIGVTKEVANAAGTRANEANSKAEAAGNASQQNAKDIEALRNTISNIEDFSVAKEVQVNFGFDKDTLSPDAQKQLDDLASQKPENGARYFLAIEGFADPIGDAEYNYQLSQRRADRVEELEPVVLHQEAERGAVRAAAEAVVELFVRAHPERRRLLVVERAAGLPLAPGLLQLDARADDVHLVLELARVAAAGGHDRREVHAHVRFVTRKGVGEIGGTHRDLERERARDWR